MLMTVNMGARTPEGACMIHFKGCTRRDSISLQTQIRLSTELHKTKKLDYVVWYKRAIYYAGRV